VREHRHPHPHIDPRQPRHNTQPRTNPPVFAWKPVEGALTYRLTIARDPELRDVWLELDGLREPLYLSESALPAGRYYWQWATRDAASEVFIFEIAADAVELEVPPADAWLTSFPDGHPRLYVRPEEVASLRESRHGERASAWRELEAAAAELLTLPHEIEEPPYLPDRRLDYRAFFDTWAPIMWESRRFVKGAEVLGLAYLASGEEKYGRAACERMASISRWDPEGSSHIGHNDEAHMSVIWHGAKACDWVWDLFTDDERELVIDQFRRRGEITYEHMHGHGSYGVTRFDSHSGREIVFLALLAIVFHEHIPQAREWLDWLRPVLCGIWPVWAGDDGAWAEGPSYGLAYVTIMTMFATALKSGTGVDLYRRPFWEGHARWRQHCWPSYAEWIGFGDHTEKWRSNWLSNARLVELIDHQTGGGSFTHYVDSLRDEAQHLATPETRGAPVVSAQSYLNGVSSEPCSDPVGDGVLEVFPAAGWAAIRTDPEDPTNDVAMIFRSSPFGAISHSHANNNDFIIHVGGKVLAMPSGYYDGYGSDHHTHWNWHTKSHNCLTLSDAPQIMRSHDSSGAIDNAYEDDRVAYLRGTADAGYADRAERCRRHVAFLKQHRCFVMVDEFVARPGIVSGLQWNIHSWSAFDVDGDARTFRLQRDDSALEGQFMVHQNSFFSLTEGWDPPPSRSKPSEQWHQQYHLRFTVSGLVTRGNLGVVLAPAAPGIDTPSITAELVQGTEVAHIGDDLALVSRDGRLRYGGVDTEALAMLVLQGEVYEITDTGIAATGRL